MSSNFTPILKEYAKVALVLIIVVGALIPYVIGILYLLGYIPRTFFFDSATPVPFRII